MALAVANSFAIQGAGGAASQALTVSGFQAGELCVVLGYAFSADTSMTFNTTIDSGGNTYTHDSTSTHDATFRSWCVLASTIVVTPPTSVTISTTGNAPISVVCLRITGAATSSPVDAADSNGTTLTADDPTTDNIVTTNANTILVSGLCHDGADVTFDAPASWTLERENESNTNQAYAAAYRIVASASTYSAQWVTGASRDYGMVLAAYKAAADVAATLDNTKQIRRSRRTFW